VKGGVQNNFLGIKSVCVNSQMHVSVSVLVGRDRAFDSVLGWSLGDGSVRTEGSLEVGDVSGTNVVDETVDVNWLEGSARVLRTAVVGRRSAVLTLLLGDVGAPVLLHYRADDDVEHRVFDILLNESAETGVIKLGIINRRLVRIGFAERNDLRAARVQVSETDRVNPFLNRTTRGVARRIRPRQHRSCDTATSVVAHDDDVFDAQGLNAVRQDADRVVIDGLELVSDVPLGKERARWRREDRTLGNSGIAASQEQVLRMLPVRREILQQIWIGGIRNRRTEVLISFCQVHQIWEPRRSVVQVGNILAQSGVVISLAISGEDAAWGRRSGKRKGGENGRRYQQNGNKELHEHDETDLLKMNVV